MIRPSQQVGRTCAVSSLRAAVHLQGCSYWLVCAQPTSASLPHTSQVGHQRAPLLLVPLPPSSSNRFKCPFLETSHPTSVPPKDLCLLPFQCSLFKVLVPGLAGKRQSLLMPSGTFHLTRVCYGPRILLLCQHGQEGFPVSFLPVEPVFPMPV